MSQPHQLPWQQLTFLTPIDWRVEPVGQQLINQTWLLTHVQEPQHQLIVKQNKQSYQFGRNIQQVLAIEYQMSEAGVGAPIVFLSAEEALVVYEYLAVPLTKAVPKRHDQIILLAEVMASIHVLKPEADTPPLEVQFEVLCQSLLQAQPHNKAKIKQLYKDYIHTLKQCAECSMVFAHNDLAFQHLYVQDCSNQSAVRVIDWEYAGYTPVGFDLAMAIVVNDLHQEEIDLFIQVYNHYAPHNAFQRDDLTAWIRVVALTNKTWFSLQQALSYPGDQEKKEDKYKRLYQPLFIKGWSKTWNQAWDRTWNKVKKKFNERSH